MMQQHNTKRCSSSSRSPTFLKVFKLMRNMSFMRRDREMGDPQRKESALCSPSMAVLLFLVSLVMASAFVLLLDFKSFRTGFNGGFVEVPLPDASPVNLSSRVMVSGASQFLVSEDSVLNRSFSSHPLSVDIVHDFANLTQEHPSNLNLSMEGPQAVPPMNESNARHVEITNLERLEAGLGKARASIREANTGNQIQDPEYVPIGPMYRNAKAFHRSYLEMEQQFKVFVYEEGEPPLFHNGPCKSIYSMEGSFINLIETDSQFRTRDPHKAQAYFLPFSVAKLVQFVYVPDSHDFGPIKHTVIDYVNVIGQKYPYWNRSLGADHFMVACHDWGPETSSAVPNLYKNSIRVLCNANTSEGFNPAKDATFPEINLVTGSTQGLLGGPSPSQRPILAFFAGGVHGPIRPVLLDRWQDKDEHIRVHQYLPKGVSYYDMMRKSKYCLCPSGYEVASPRVVEAIYTGCVPVLISDHYVPPFSDVLNWKSFSVEVSVEDIPNLKTILSGISARQYIRMHRRVTQIRRHFEVNSPPKRFDVYHMILHSVWLRRLNVRVHNHDSYANV